jgi:hypothetical protein
LEGEVWGVLEGAAVAVGQAHKETQLLHFRSHYSYIFINNTYFAVGLNLGQTLSRRIKNLEEIWQKYG